MKRVLLFIFVSILFVSCVSTKKAEKVPDYENDLAPREVPYSNCFAVLPFTLRYTLYNFEPVIKINSTFYLLDTGTNKTMLSDKGLKDLFPWNYERVIENKNLLPNNGDIIIFNEPVGDWVIPSYKGKEKFIPFYYTNSSFEPYHGIIGEDAFMKFSNVIIDYKNMLIVFDGEPVSEDQIPMLIDEEGLCFIEFSCEGKNETGLLDTGAKDFLLRSTYFEKPCEYDFLTKEKVQELKKRKVELTERKEYSFNDIEIGKIKYNDITGFLSSDSSVFITDEGRARTTEYSVIGYPFFKDKIIQLDYKNKVFRIKE